MAARRVPPAKPLTKVELARLETQERSWRAIVGANIRKARTAAGLSQDQLSVRSDVSANYLSLAELGRRGVTIDFLARIAFALNVSPADFLIQD
jgi:ribosome-binding protein aMBF1 (putative translation factor)